MRSTECQAQSTTESTESEYKVQNTECRARNEIPVDLNEGTAYVEEKNIGLYSEKG